MLRPGLVAVAEVNVTDADTAVALGSGDVPVLATPRVLAMMEEVTVSALAGRLGPGQTSVGTRVVLSHLSATPVGRRVRTVAEVTAVRGNAVTFHAAVLDVDRRVAEAEITRVVVDRQRFIRRAI